MKNERGLTLVELLAVLAIVGVIMALLGSVLINGIKASNRTTTRQQLQQEANYITEVVRNEYLGQGSGSFTIYSDDVNQTLKIESKIISEGYIYKLCYEGENEEEEE
ncbi:type II secretion system protein, partial [Filibacter tadaridae]